MLLGGIALLSAIAAGIIGVGSGAFQSWQWLWVLPVGFVGAFVVLGILAFGFLWGACAAVDLEKPQEEDSRFYRKMMYLYEHAVFSILQVHMDTAGLEQTPQDGRFMVVCNHMSVLDPLVLHLCFEKSQLAFISKQENRNMFIIGKLMHKTLCQSINRDNDREALKTILKCIQILKEDKASVGVFPEGYTYQDDLLHSFRSGVFKIAQKAKVPIVVCTMGNTRQIFHNALRLRRTVVPIHLCAVLPPEELAGQTAVAIADRVHAIMAEDLGPERVAE